MPFTSNQFPIKDSLLIASPLLDDGIFDHSIILITQYNPEKGAIGFILNHPAGQTLGEVSKKGTIPKELEKIPIYRGGPVEPDALTFIEFSRKSGKLSYKPQISIEQAAESTSQPGTIVQAFAGFSQWVENQLERELEQFAWIRAKASPKLLDFSQDLSMWKDLLRQISPYHAILAEAPKKPYLN